MVLRALLLIIFLVGCSPTTAPDNQPLDLDGEVGRPRLMNPTEPPDFIGLSKGEVVPPNSEEAQEILKKEGADWFYGKGLGATILNVGAIFVFPPYGLYLVFNAGMKMAGEEPIYISDALPDGAREGVQGAYDEVVGVPGKVTSRLANEQYRE